MTMVNSALTATPNRGVSLRKTNKPLMEKRRRARINDSLSQLKSLVIHSSKKDSSQFSKLEKADILELTVKHLRGLQAQQQQQLQQQHHHMATVQNGPASTDTLLNGKYRAGFVECANEVIRYLDQSQGLNQETKTKVVSHLAGCLQLVSNTSNNNNNNNNNNVNHSNHSKIAPQPVNTVPVHATSQQPQQPPTNAAAILAAAAAAATGGNPTTTTTQLPNGQIIQIVSGNPLQNVQPVAPSSAQAVLGLNPSAAAAASQTAPHTPNKPVVVHSQHQQQSTPNNPAYIHYTQPLHIQIPPIVSPVLIQKESQPQQQTQTQHHSTHIDPREPRCRFSSTSSSLSSSSSSLPDQVNDIVSSSTSLAPTPPQPHQRVSTSPPSSLYPGHPKARAQKQLNFFSQQEYSKSSSSSSLFSSSNSHKYSNPRIIKNPLTLTPPSSSGSSSESENTSPLNLSQSPPSFSSYHNNNHNHKSEPQLQQQRRYLSSDANQKDNIVNLKQQQQQQQQPSTVNSKPFSLLGENLALKDSNNNNNNIIPYTTHAHQQTHATSVIVNSKTSCADFSNGKYWSMMEEDRHYARHQNTPSPASSVGDERLWRPW